MGRIKIAYLIKGVGAYNSHIKPLIDNCPFEEYDFFILHLNRLFTPDDIVQDQRVTFIDLTKNWNLKKVFKKNEIDLIGTINPGNIFDLFTVSLANFIGTPTVYYQHGIQLDFTSFDPKKLSQRRSLSRIIKSIIKYLFFILYFIYNLILFSDRKNIFSAIFLKFKYLVFPRFYKNVPKYGLRKSHCKYAFVYGQRDKRYLIESMGMEEKNILITGYPFLKPVESCTASVDQKVALFISAGLRRVGVIPISLSQEVQFYRELSEKVNKIGYVLYVKLHPLENENDFRDFLSSNSIRFFKNKNLTDLTLCADLILGEYSTALFYPIKYYKPLFIMKSEYFDHYPFDFTKYGVGISTTMQTVVEDIVNNSTLSDNQLRDYRSFLSEYVMNSYDEDPIEMYYNTISKILASKELINFSS